MYKYQSFCEYLQFNYSEKICDFLKDFIQEYEQSKSQKTGKPCIDIYIQNLQIDNAKFIKNKIDYLEFVVLLSADYSILRDLFEGTFDNSTNRFYAIMGGSFDEGFHLIKSTAYKGANVPEKLTRGLVPVIAVKDMDEYAEKFLQEFCPQALESPMPLPLFEILEEKGIDFYYAPMDDAIFAKTYFAEDTVKVFLNTDDSDSDIKEIRVYPGTILVNLAKHTEYPEGTLRNTIVHELVHWFFHRNYFALRQCLNPEDTFVACYKGGAEFFTSDIDWMEWQARSLAPRILMPQKTALEAYDAICAQVNSESEYLIPKSESGHWHSTVLDRFAKFFDVSKESARIRLSELGKTGFDGVSRYVDGRYLTAYTYNEKALKKSQTYTISIDELFEMLVTNFQLQDAIQKEQLVYANSMLVVNNPKYFNTDTYTLTDYALTHANECCVAFQISYRRMNSNTDGSCLYNGSKFKKLNVDMKALCQLIANADENAAHYEQHKHELPDSFHETLKYHFDKAKGNHSINSLAEFEFMTGIMIKTLRNYMSGKTKPERMTTIKMALAMKLSAPYIIDLLQKADQMMTLMNRENIVLFTIIYGYQRVGLEETYRLLKENGLGNILNLSQAFIDSIE